MAAIFSGPGAAIATILHALGAIGYLAGVAMYVSWQRSIRSGHDNPTVLATAAGVTYISILVNLLGGFIRTYQPGHPPLTAFVEEPWVALMTIKHVALFLGIGAAVYLFEVAAPRFRRLRKAGNTLATKNASIAAATVLLSIVIATVLGGASTVVQIGDPMVQDDAPPAAVVPFGGARHFFNGTISSGDSGDTGSFDAPEGTQSITAVLEVSGQAVDPSQVTLSLIDPNGAQRSATTTGTSGPKSAQVEYSEPVPGRWQYRVSGDVALQSSWSLVIDVEGIPETIVEDTITLAAGDFLEIDLAVGAGIELAWDWSTDGPAVDWDIHTHAGEGQTIRSGTADADAGSYITRQDGGHSFFWQATEPTVLTYRLSGYFVVDAVTS